MIVPTVLRGFSDEYGSWKIICISRRSGLSSPCESLAMSRPSQGIDPPGDEPCGRRLAAAGLADDAERLAAQEVEAHAVDRFDGPDLLAEDQAALDREVLLEVADLHQDVAHAPSPPLAGTAPGVV